MPAVDVVVPCYNYARYLETCVASILAQDGVAVRVLIVDDCSSDETPTVASQLAAGDSRVSVVRNAVNLGLIGSANRGMIDWAEAPYSLLLSADDALTPGALARATAVLESHPEAGFVFGPVLVFGADPPPPAAASERFEHRIVAGPTLIEHLCHHCNDVPTPTAVVRTALQKRVGGYNPATPHTSDMEMWLRLAAHADVGVIHATQGYYRVHGSNMSGEFIAQPTRDAQQRITAAEQAALAAGDRVAEFPRVLRTMRRIEARRAYWRAGLAFEVGERALGDVYLRFAATTDPSPLSAPGFWSASVKRALGPGALRALRRLAGRPSPKTTVLARELRPAIELTPGQLWGWWPDAPRPNSRAGPAKARRPLPDRNALLRRRSMP
jgi:glycosyltransferase involved in cell wall biosynthesis